MKKYTSRTLVLEAVMICVGLLFLVPLYVLVNESFKSPADLSGPLSPATHPTGQNYVHAWNEAGLGHALLMSVQITVFSTAVLVFVSAMAAYPLARNTRRWSSIAFYGFMVGLLLPFQLALIPLYMTMRDLGLLGSPLSLIIFYSGHLAPFSIFLYTGFLRSLAPEYEEAAAVDGCGIMHTFWRIVFPLLRPITGTVIILNILNVWNDFYTPLLYLSGSPNTTVPVALYSFVGEFVSQWNLVFAGLVISIAPVLIVYFLMQRTIIKGFSSGLKG
ncbi:carbohydrate ABC transporter permease [Actinospica robiniae]|uniref:carbohydrate ABC transporter permease n=1 Tax=Actinospica robiniae TaxID=304901 RepID=UPI000403D6FA|nr:carbohydrate ABC transporter permease [Actinospica robiniae]